MLCSCLPTNSGDSRILGLGPPAFLIITAASIGVPTTRANSYFVPSAVIISLGASIVFTLFLSILYMEIQMRPLVSALAFQS